MSPIPFLCMLLAWILARIEIHFLSRGYNNATKRAESATDIARSALDELRKANDGFERAIECMHKVNDEYEELGARYHSLCVAYTIAYGILKEHDLLPKDDNEPDTA